MERIEILNEAKKLLGTKFKHQGRNEHGLDCAGLIIFVCKKLGVHNVGMDLKGYGRTPDGNKIARIMSDFFDITDYENAESGDVLLFKFINNPQHLAFFERDDEGNEFMIHSYGEQEIEKVVYHRFDEKWKNRLVAVYKVKMGCK